MAVTMKTIARAANVDPSVVSTVINNRTNIRVSKAKRELILQLVRDMNYRPNMIARTLATRKSYTVGLLFSSIRDRFYAAVVTELQMQLARMGYIGLFASWETYEEAESACANILSRGVDGIICAHDDHSLLPPDIPAVIFGSPAPGRDSFSTNYTGALRNSLDYLSSLGHKSVGFIGKAANRPGNALCRQMAAEYGMKTADKWMVECDGFFSDSCQAALKFLRSPVLPTALIAKNDMIALAVISAAHQLGFSLPGDLSVIGFNDLEESSYCHPPLTTSGINIPDFASELIRTLMAKMKNPDTPSRDTVLDMEFVIRGSCAPPGNLDSNA